MSDSGDTRLKTPRTRIAQGEKDQIIERHAAQVNGHDLAKCEGWEGPLTPEEGQRGVSPAYRFWACENCGREATTPPQRWETVECDGDAR